MRQEFLDFQKRIDDELDKRQAKALERESAYKNFFIHCIVIRNQGDSRLRDSQSIDSARTTIKSQYIKLRYIAALILLLTYFQDSYLRNRK